MVFIEAVNFEVSVRCEERYHAFVEVLQGVKYLSHVVIGGASSLANPKMLTRYFFPMPCQEVTLSGDPNRDKSLS